MADSMNQQIADRLTERQLLAGRVENSLRRDVWDQLRILEDEILSALKSSDPTEFALLSRRRREVEALMAEELDPLIAARYTRLARLMDEAMGRLAVNEAHATEQIVNSVADEQVIEETPADATLKRRVAGALFPTPARPTDLSATGSTWWVRQGESLSQRIGDSLLVGVSLEESLTQLTQRVRGTSDNGFRDGLMAKARDDAARLLTTQTTNAIGEARVAVAERNAQQVVLQHQALIEEKNVCMICFARHGKRFRAEPPHEPIGHELPFLNGTPYHPLCRCSIITVVASGGAITDETLAAWLRRQGTAYQNDVLGPTRAAMFRAGKLSPKDLLASSTGRPLTLEELGA